jgi:hypothetical protein
MAPPRVGGPSAAAKKQAKQKEVSPEVEEVAEFHFDDTNRVSQRLLTTKGG